MLYKMKKITLIFSMLAIISTVISQTPQAFKYQAVARYSNGDLIQDQSVSFRISILQGAASGTLIYQESHLTTTDNYGLANLEIGTGTVLSGVFVSIDWSAGLMFMKVELDPAGGTAFLEMGITQLLSVPYALHARTSEKFRDMITEERDTLTNVPEGVCFFNTSTKKLNFYDGTNWFELLGNCTPDPTPANAGPDQTDACPASYLAGNTPQYGTGIWEIVSGTGGNVIEPDNPTSQFTGLEGNSYLLKWTITNNCGFAEDEVNISIASTGFIADAGPDQINVPSPTILSGNTPLNGTGQWTIISGVGGVIDDPSNPASGFSGLAYNSYTLRWTLTTSCGISSDDMNISFTTSAFNCGTTLTDYRDGKTYPTVLIGTQCWMAKNMNVGTRIEGVANMANNSILEKYCTSNLESNCDIYGGLYQWAEMMQYTTTPGTQGICTPGWHLPTDQEIKTLEGTIDSQYGVGDPIWDLTGDRGLDAGGKMKETGNAHWVFPNVGATNTSGFTGLGGGTRNTNGSYSGFQIYGIFWTSTESSTNAYRRVLSASRADIARDAVNKLVGLSVRCVKD